MGIAIKIEGLTAVKISRALGVPVSSTYEWPDQHRTAIVKGVVLGPSTHNGDTALTSQTREVSLGNIRRTEIVHGVETVIPGTPGQKWGVDTESVTLHIFGK
ncbi:hypothetical protein A2363_00680 [Candidatus Gottesmanbacteria bacterium RIFOXYB1_FULL_47_11]|uniref:Transposase n=1 Tax=Candidatus Gottesmanbacteria bacterium RIFOXYB1_FULL_47_11 TaxID=1798401 RepID=A0A1F6BBV6_9BACT|nr:MAG: hypothetical protein A2363_00680 [Candidatus Gottesmanbacteria bacterium RIFOXYB1_FULL_47_11]